MKITLSPDITITKTQSVTEILYELDGKVEAIRVDLNTKIDAVRDELKQEIQEVRTELKQEIQEVRSEIKSVDKKIDRVRADLTQEIKAVESRVMSRIDGLRAEMKAGMTQMEPRITGTIGRELKFISAQIGWYFAGAALLVALAPLFRAMAERLTAPEKIAELARRIADERKEHTETH